MKKQFDQALYEKMKQIEAECIEEDATVIDTCKRLERAGIPQDMIDYLFEQWLEE